MKKNKKILFIGLIIFTFGVFVPTVNAIVKVVDEYAYSFEKVNLTCDSLHLIYPIDATNKGITLFMHDEEDKYDYYYWRGNSNCAALDNQEKLDAYNKSSSIYKYDDEDNKLYEYNAPSTLSGGYSLTKDTVALERKIYYKLLGPNNFSARYGLQVKDDVSSYYESIRLTKPKSTVIDKSLKYYKLVDNIITLVEDPISEDVMDYYFIYNEKDYRKIVNKFPKNEVDVFVDDYISSLSNATKIARNITKIGDNYYIIVSYYKDGVFSDSETVYFNEDFEIVPEFTNKRYNTYGNFIIENEYSNYVYRIYDKKFNLLFTLNEENANKILSVYEHNDVMLLSLSYDDNYLLTKYSVLEGDNLIFNNQDLPIKFNGFNNSLSDVKVNDVYLADDNYTHEPDKTIILKQSYLKELVPGTYKLKAEYTDGGFSLATFVVQEPPTPIEEPLIPVQEENPQTGDSIMISIIIGSVSLIGLLGVGLYLKKQNVKIDFRK